MIKLFIVDSYDVIRKGLQFMLENQDFKIIGNAPTGKIALEKLRKNAANTEIPDVIVIDIHILSANCVEITQRLSRFFPKLKIIGIGTCKDPFLASSFLQAGGSGYITKEASVKELTQAIKTVYLGKNYISHVVANRLATFKYTNKASTFQNLSHKEKQVTTKILQGKTPDETATELNLSIKTIHAHRYKIFKKMGIKSDAELVRLATKEGILEQ